MKMPPPFLALIIIAYVAYSIWPVLMGAAPKDLGLVMLSWVVALFAFHGSAIACNVLAIACALIAQSTLGMAVESFDSQVGVSVLLAVTAAVLARAAHYLLFDAAVKVFQGKDVSRLSSERL
ncbi:hypothetical protein [Pseudomonas sp. NPDC089534]|uniref:hypothetical protein n=1 Tax=Pseudomonas sp. NPDC089534 TaxID=3364468 RepID=UPI0038115974